MNAADIRRLPKSLRFGGTRLHHGYSTGEAPQPDGVRRINAQCIELETFANLTRSGAAIFIGMSMVSAVAISIFITCAIRYLTPDVVLGVSGWLDVIFLPWFLVIFAVIIYFLSGAHRNRGAFIRIHRGTRKLYYTFPGKTHLHVLDWDQLEVLAGYIPIVSGSGYASRHPLYLIGVDYAFPQPGEVCVACGNLGAYVGDRSAKSLWEYLQLFMAHGPHDLPPPPPPLSNMTRQQAAWRHFHEWRAALRTSLATTKGKLWAPVVVPIRVFWLFFWILPNCLEEYILYNVPYTPFPKEIDELCGFAEKRKPIIRVNGKVVDE